MKSITRLKCCINNEWFASSSGKYLPVFNPSTGEQIAETPSLTKDEVVSAVLSARNSFQSWAETPVQMRTKILFKFRELLVNNLDELTVLLSTEMGKVISDAKADVMKTIEGVECACSTQYHMLGDSAMNLFPGQDTVLYHEPVGVFSGIVPFNFPAMIPFGWIVPFSIAAGNTLVLKASNKVPQTAMRMLELLQNAGLPAGVVNLVTCGHDETEILLSHPEISGVSFVGSTASGRHVYETCAKYGKRVQALTAAKNHALVLSDCDVKETVARVLGASFSCAGQRCMALPVVCIEEAIAAEFVKHIVEMAHKIKVGPANSPDSQLGPVATEALLKRVKNAIENGIKEGAEIILDGRNVRVPGFEKGYYIGPTIFDHVNPGMSIGEEEVFGPVLCIKRINSLEHGIETINNSRFGKGASIFTKSMTKAGVFKTRINTGMVGINIGIPSPYSIFPFSGRKDSFFGDLNALGRESTAFYTQPKVVTSSWL